MKKLHFLASRRDPMSFLAKPSRAKIQPNWILQFLTLIETMGSVVFTRGPFEVDLPARPITILSPCLALDEVKIYKLSRIFILGGGEDSKFVDWYINFQLLNRKYNTNHAMTCRYIVLCLPSYRCLLSPLHTRLFPLPVFGMGVFCLQFGSLSGSKWRHCWLSFWLACLI